MSKVYNSKPGTKLAMTKEQLELIDTIVRNNDGCVRFNLTKAAKIVGRSRTGFPGWLHERGIVVEKSGKDKYVTVNDLAVAITIGRVSPL